MRSYIGRGPFYFCPFKRRNYPFFRKIKSDLFVESSVIYVNLVFPFIHVDRLKFTSLRS